MRFLYPCLAFVLCAAAPPEKEEKEAPYTDNKNGLVKEYKEKLVATASTFWPGWPPELLLDGNPERSWFSAKGDAAAKGTKPWVQVAFPGDEVVTRVTVLGNRESPWADNFSVLSGLVEFFDADGKVLWAEEQEGSGKRHDFEFKPKKPVKGVRTIKFTSLKDEGDKNSYDDIAIGEILID